MPDLPLLRNALEPAALHACFLRHPPEGFHVLEDVPVPAFVAPFDLLTTADDEFKARITGFVGYSMWSRWLTIRTAFVGTTVSEYAVWPPQLGVNEAVQALLSGPCKAQKLTIIKDLPQQSPLLSEDDNAYADAVVAACQQAGFVPVEGQALAYVPITFASTQDYLDKLPKDSRRYLRRKLRTREQIDVTRVYTGAAFDDDQKVDEYYALYQGVYAQSDVHFDKLTKAFFTQLLRDQSNGGIVFEYRHAETQEFLGWNLCFEHQGKLVDKYIGLSYPLSREMNLYFVSWFVNLEYALEKGLSHYVAGWTDPGVKALLGATFTPTRHMVYVRNPILRALARRFANRFESDSQWITS